MVGLRSLLQVLAIGLAVLTLVGCGGNGGSSGTTTSDPDDLVVDTQEEGGPDWAKSKADPAPGRVALAFVEAAIAKDYEKMWNTLSKETQARIAPDYETFARDVAKDFAASIGAFVREELRVVTSVTTGSRTAVASVAGDRIDPASKKKEFETFGAAMLKQGAQWKLELFGPIVLTLVIPEERIAQSKPRVAVSAEAGAPILEVGVWIDGKQYPSPTEGASPTQLTIFAEAEEEFAPGNHTVMAFASVGDTAVATSWTFIIAE
jgi:hypothetical protein